LLLCVALLLQLPSAVVLYMAGVSTQLFGSELKVTLHCPQVDIEEELCVWGLPRNMASEVLLEAVKHYFKHCTGYEVAHCTLLNEGVAHMSFRDPGAVRELLNNPPTQAFGAGCSLQFSTPSQQPSYTKRPYTAPVSRPQPKPRRRIYSGQDPPSGEQGQPKGR